MNYFEALTAKLRASAAAPSSSGSSTGGSSAPAAPADFINISTFWAQGYTPASDGTMLVQNLCRDCHAEVYQDSSAPAPLMTVPVGPTPTLTAAPETWVQVPVKSGVKLSIAMNGASSEPDHLHEVTAIFLPGAITLAAGPMPRHAKVDDTPPPPPPENTTDYYGYRLRITEGGDGNYVQIAELELKDKYGTQNFATGSGGFDNGNIGSNFAGAKAFDGDVSSSFLAPGNATEAAPKILGYNFNQLTQIGQYTITALTGARAPRSWVLEATKDGQDWVQRHAMSAQGFADGESKTFTFIFDSD